ncbi:hypothetical protein JNUCC1_00163 [Lentibacillus sp. JNUCC-1]|uniref:hypothetical protein n=1 Tax=Lentibacillus sp. JNUCC-1 TaxID=2654513 RepID=UPI0012E7D202|nr:hypothetical protein [Lentibacillus sp. JNUCC-1]MUV36361.1 hypothetical protein [Lentibacillus sp. JNUCC-1]
MKMLGTVKGKLIAGTLAVGVISGSGFALANTDAGENLKNWYEGVFNDRVAAAEEEADAYAESKEQEFEGYYADRKDHQGGIVDRHRNKQTNNAIDGIAAAKQSHLEDLGATKQEIMGQMEVEFYDAFVAGTAEIVARGDAAEQWVKDDLEAFGIEQESRMLEQVTNDLTAAKEEAVTDLEEAIEAAKQEVSAEVEARGENLEGNFRTQINHQLTRIENKTNEILQRLQEEQKTIISEHAADLEQEAKNALDDVVSGI